MPYAWARHFLTFNSVQWPIYIASISYLDFSSTTYNLRSAPLVWLDQDICWHGCAGGIDRSMLKIRAIKLSANDTSYAPMLP
jgi:hypothetical protein